MFSLFTMLWPLLLRYKPTVIMHLSKKRNIRYLSQKKKKKAVIFKRDKFLITQELFFNAKMKSRLM